MEKTMLASKEDFVVLQSEIDSLEKNMEKEIEGLRSTIAILQDKDMMEQIHESEENRAAGKGEEFEY